MVTFVTMAYIVILNPIIQVERHGCRGRHPLAATGLRRLIFTAVPIELKLAITVGIGLFIAFIGFVDAGFVTATGAASPPVGLGVDGSISTVPTVVFVVTLLVTGVLVARKVKGGILIGLLSGTVLALVLEAALDLGPKVGPDGALNPQGWGLSVPELPAQWVSLSDFSVLLPVFLTVTVMPLTYSIANGIGAGFIGWVVIRSLAGRARDISPLLGRRGRLPRVLRARPGRSADRRLVERAGGGRWRQPPRRSGGSPHTGPAERFVAWRHPLEQEIQTMTTVTPAPATATDLEQRGFAVSSLVLGLVSFVAGFTFVVPVAGLVLGILALRREPSARTMAIWGIVLNAVMLAGVLIAGLVAAAIGLAALPFLPFAFA